MDNVIGWHNLEPFFHLNVILVFKKYCEVCLVLLLKILYIYIYIYIIKINKKLYILKLFNFYIKKRNK